jgi:hypothetical protein
VQPSVIERFFSHATFAQNPSADATSVKPAQGAASAGDATIASSAGIASDDTHRVNDAIAHSIE